MNLFQYCSTGILKYVSILIQITVKTLSLPNDHSFITIYLFVLVVVEALDNWPKFTYKEVVNLKSLCAYLYLEVDTSSFK